MGEALKELGKTFYTIAVLILGVFIVKPFVGGKTNIFITLLGLLLFLITLSVGFFLIVWGEKIKQKEE